MPEDVVRIALVTFYCVYASAIISLLLLFCINPDIDLIDNYNILICAVRCHSWNSSGSSRYYE